MTNCVIHLTRPATYGDYGDECWPKIATKRLERLKQQDQYIANRLAAYPDLVRAYERSYRHRAAQVMNGGR